MKKPDEIKKGLECASNCSENLNGCENCPYNGLDCCDLHPDALVLIQQLEADNAQLNRCIENLTDKLNAMNDEVAKLQAERDAAVKDLQTVCNMMNICRMCKDDDEGSERCEGCLMSSNWEWRGVTKEE